MFFLFVFGRFVCLFCLQFCFVLVFDHFVFFLIFFLIPLIPMLMYDVDNQSLTQTTPPLVVLSPSLYSPLIKKSYPWSLLHSSRLDFVVVFRQTRGPRMIKDKSVEIKTVNDQGPIDEMGSEYRGKTRILLFLLFHVDFYQTGENKK